MKIILASASPRRKELMKNLGLEFDVLPSSYEEDMAIKKTPKELAKFLSYNKAKAVADDNFEALVIGADTFVALKNELLGKPHTPAQARKTLQKISNKKLSVITGLTVICKNKKISATVETKVYIKKLSETEINNYIRTKEPLDKAGGFGIQGLGALIIKKIEGDYFNIVGLPLFALARILKKFGVKVL